MKLIRVLVTLFIALIMMKLFIDLVMFLFVNTAIADKKAMDTNLRGY